MTKEMRQLTALMSLVGDWSTTRFNENKNLVCICARMYLFCTFYSAYIPPKAKTSHFKSQGLVNVAQYLECDKKIFYYDQYNREKKGHFPFFTKFHYELVLCPDRGNYI